MSNQVKWSITDQSTYRSLKAQLEMVSQYDNHKGIIIVRKLEKIEKKYDPATIQ